jgi:glucose-6-phosphate-specific signal transduction histidine kinase
VFSNKIHYHSSITGLTVSVSGSIIISPLLHIISEQHSHKQIAHPDNSTMHNSNIKTTSYGIIIYYIRYFL